MKSLFKATFSAAIILSSVPVVYAQSAQPAQSAQLPQSAQSDASASTSMSTGEVKKVDKSVGKLTIKHGPLKNLGMDAMTMVFRVQDPAMLDDVKAGDKINFVAEEPNGQLTVARLEKQQ